MFEILLLSFAAACFKPSRTSGAIRRLRFVDLSDGMVVPSPLTGQYTADVPRKYTNILLKLNGVLLFEEVGNLLNLD